MKKIIVLGPSGTGKTTLARKLGEKLGIPYLHLDTVYWKKNWIHVDKKEFHNFMVSYLKQHGKWVIDGNYTNNEHFIWRLKLADTIILLDFPSTVSLRGILERAEKYKNRVRSDMAEGCVEGIDQVFLRYTAFYSKNRTPLLKAKINKYSKGKNIFIFNNRENLENWLNTF